MQYTLQSSVLSSSGSRQAVGLSQPLIQWAQGLPFPEVQVTRLRRQADIYLHVMRSLGMSGAKPPPIHMVYFLIKHIDNFIFLPDLV